MKKTLLSGLVLTFLGFIAVSCTSKQEPKPIPAVKVLTGISITQDANQKEFDLNSEFNYEGLKVSASFITGDVSSSEDVTSDIVVSSPDMSSKGEKDANISYTYNEVVKTTSYKITVNEVVSKKAKLTALAAAPNNYINFSGVTLDQEYDVGSELVITLDLVRPLAGSATIDHYHLFVNNTELSLSQVGTEQKLKATYVVEDKDFTIYGFYNDMVEDQNGYTLTLDNPSTDLAVFGFDTSKKYTKMYGFVTLKEGYTMNGIKWKYEGEEEYRNGALNNNFQPTNVTQLANHPELYTFKIRETGNQAVTGNVHVLFDVVEETKYTITYTYDNEELVNKTSSVLPSESTAGKKNYLTIVTKSNNDKFVVSSDDIELEETFNYGQYGFTMPKKNIEIHISLTEATLNISWNKPDGVSAFIKKDGDYYSSTITKLIPGETYHLMAASTQKVIDYANLNNVKVDLNMTSKSDDDGNVIFETTFVASDIGSNQMNIEIVLTDSFINISLDSSFSDNATISSPRCKIGVNYLVKATFEKEMTIVIKDSDGNEKDIEVTSSHRETEGFHVYEFSFVTPSYDITISFKEAN